MRNTTRTGTPPFQAHEPPHRGPIGVPDRSATGSAVRCSDNGDLREVDMGSTTTAKLDELARGILGSKLLFESGFEYLRGVFHRELPTGVRHLIVLDLNRSKGTFVIIVGVNSKVLSGDLPPDQAGAYHSCYVSRGGITRTPAGFAAKNVELTAESLERAVTACRQYALPWLHDYTTLSAFADALPETCDLFKGRLLLAHGAPERAKPWLLHYRERLRAMPPSPDVTEAERDTDVLLKRCESPVSG